MVNSLPIMDHCALRRHACIYLPVEVPLSIEIGHGVNVQFFKDKDDTTLARNNTSTSHARKDTSPDQAGKEGHPHLDTPGSIRRGTIHHVLIHFLP